MFQFLVHVRALVVGLAGVGLAWLWFNEQGWIAAALAVVSILVGLTVDGAGRRFLPARPLVAVRLMEWWVLSPAMVAAVGAGAVVIITVGLAAPETASDQTKELIGSLSTGLTGFITATLVSWTSDENGSVVSDHIRSAFRQKYARSRPPSERAQGVHYFPPDSEGERWVFSEEYGGVTGWGRSARLRRASGVAEALRDQEPE